MSCEVKTYKMGSVVSMSIGSDCCVSCCKSIQRCWRPRPRFEARDVYIETESSGIVYNVYYPSEL